MSERIEFKIEDYSDQEDAAYRLNIKYYVATEKGFSENLSIAIRERFQSTMQGKGKAALLLGNSYLLSTIALLPDDINIIYLCDIDEDILIYAKQIMECANNADDYHSFKESLKRLNQQYTDLNLTKDDYKNEDYLKERFLDEEAFKKFKEKINSLIIHPIKINLLKAAQVKKIIDKIGEDKIAFINFSNLHQFAKDGEFNSLLSKFGEVAVEEPLVFYSYYRTPNPRLESRYYHGPLDRYFARSQKIGKILNQLQEEKNPEMALACYSLLPENCQTLMPMDPQLNGQRGAHLKQLLARDMNVIPDQIIHEIHQLLLMDHQKKNSYLKIQGYFNQAIQMAECYKYQEVIVPLCKQLYILRSRTLKELRHNQINKDRACLIAESTKDLIFHLTQSTIRSERLRAIDSYEEKMHTLGRAVWWLRQIVSILIGAAIGFVLGLLVGACMGPAAVLAAVLGGAKGAIIGGVVGGGVGASIGAGVGFFTTRDNDAAIHSVVKEAGRFCVR